MSKTCISLLALLLSVSFAEAEIVSSPFGPRSSSEGQTLFVEVPSEQSGVVTTNNYDDPRIWGERHGEHSVGAIGTGVTVGDFDGDGRPDIFIVSKVESGRLFRNLGDWRFEDVTSAAGVEDTSGEWKQGASFADVNNDGWLDLYVCRFRAANQLFINQGDGTFKEEASVRGLAVIDASGMACFADYDHDGWLDVYIQTNIMDDTTSVGGQRDYLFRNKGNGFFGDVTQAAGILDQVTQGHSATWWDQNEDGWLDLYIANDFAPGDFLYRNNRNGSFSNVIDESLPHTPFSAMGSDFGDVDNDGHIDLFVADMAGSTREFTQRGLANSRAKMNSNYNEQMDVAIQVHSNALYLGNGTSRSLEAGHLAGIAGTDWTWSPRFEDLDNDGRLDLFVTNGMDREHNNLDFIVKKLTAVNILSRIRLTKNFPVLEQANLAYVNRGDLLFEEVGAQWGLNKRGVSFGSAFGDFDGDGDLDVVFTNYQEGATLLRNGSQDGNSIVVELRGTESNRFGVGARVEVETEEGIQARQLILARGYLSTSEPVVHFGFGKMEIVDSLKVIWPSGREQVFEGLATGRKYTITESQGEVAVGEAREVATEFAGQGEHVLFEEISQTVGLVVLQREEELEGTVEQPLLPRRFNRRGPGIAVGDVDGDGVDEIVFGATAVDGAEVFRQSQGVFHAMSLGAVGAKPPINDGPPLIFDANGDGTSDLLFTGGGAALPAEEPEYEPRLWLGDGAGKFSRASEGALSSEPISVGAAVSADFDRDGALDLFLGGRLFPGYYPEAATSALLLQRKGKLVDSTKAFAPELGEVGLVTSALASDVDGDGWIDLVVCLEWGGVRVFRNLEGRKLVDESVKLGFDSAGSGLWTSIAAGDFNRDGRMDYAVGNVGLNTSYTASAEHPLSLYVGDFAGSGADQLVLAQYENGSLYPVASRAELVAKIPAVQQHFPSNDRYAQATLEEVFSKEALAKSTVYEASELRAGVLLSQASGEFRFSPLPRLAQIAPVQGMAASDFDGDGNVDLLLVNNDYSAIPAMGRFDGGLGCLLLGDGAGGFKNAPVGKSGWIVPGNAKSLSVVDFDLDCLPDLVVGRSNQSSLAFRTVGSGKGIHFGLRLHGTGGNRKAIGARVLLLVDGEPVQVYEVYAGGGIASQSTASLFYSLEAEQAARSKFRVLWPSGAVTEASVPETGGYLDLREVE